VAAVADEHIPVMLDRVLALLGPALASPGAVLVDATIGRGGHTIALLAAHPELVVVGVDRDAEAISRSRHLLESKASGASRAGRVTLVQGRYDELPEILDELGYRHVQGLLFDLGVSSPQLDQPERGFSYAVDAPLDMRMDRGQELSAADVVNTYSAAQLARVLREFGEERFAHRIADAVVRERARSAITSTSRLSDIVRTSIPAAARRTGGHPAKRTFQALRIEVNGELAVLERALPSALDALAAGGRIVVLAYHSLEDRIVKQALARQVTDTTPHGLPLQLAAGRPKFRLLTRGAERPSEEETARNPRAASARLRAAQRVAA
jgi:16S rRNA (cytosine1402-N4)-methyltransferase